MCIPFTFHLHALEKEMAPHSFTFHLHALEKEMATHSSVLAWRIPGSGEPGGLPSMGSQSRTRLKRLSSNSSKGLKNGKLTQFLPLKAGKFPPHSPPQPSSTNEDTASTDDIICFHVESLPSQGSGGVSWGPSQSWPSPPPSAEAPI